ncbi:A24 family peptidase [Brevundimonas sp.]|uniref:A24 family peptidase n=1 Tax=Brevundimonas sp. TaxID=1871086 RepID=UPI003F6E4E86
MDTLYLSLLAVMPALLIIAGLKDLTTMKIPNWVSLALVVTFPIAAIAVGLPLETVAISVGVSVVALFVGAGMFALNWIGGGDAKVMAASCLWLGVQGSGMFVLWTALVGGLFCLFLLFARFHSRPYLLGAPGWVVQLMEPRGAIPYGVAICAGALLAWPSSPLMAAFIAG